MAQTVTDALGSYRFYGPPALAPYQYYFFIPPSQFQTGHPLASFIPSPYFVGDRDDDMNQNGMPASNPEVTGVTTPRYDAMGGSMPTDSDRETGYLHDSDNDDDDSDW